MDIIWLQNLRFFPLTILHFSTKTKITVAKQQILNNGIPRRALKVGFGSVWPDLAKNSALWKYWGFIYYRQNFEPTLAIFGFGPNWWLFYVDKYWKNIAIWSHCWGSKCLRFYCLILQVKRSNIPNFNLSHLIIWYSLLEKAKQEIKF